MNQNQIRVFKDTKKRANEFAAYTDANGTSYPWVPRDLLEVVDVALPPEDYSEDLYTRQELADAPYVVYARKSDEQIEQMALSKRQAAATAYLRETDWHVTRYAETGRPIPADVLAKRQEARDAFSNPSPAVSASDSV